jgi:hypothetical protein
VVDTVATFMDSVYLYRYEYYLTPSKNRHELLHRVYERRNSYKNDIMKKYYTKCLIPYNIRVWDITLYLANYGIYDFDKNQKKNDDANKVESSEIHDTTYYNLRKIAEYNKCDKVTPQ